MASYIVKVQVILEFSLSSSAATLQDALLASEPKSAEYVSTLERILKEKANFSSAITWPASVVVKSVAAV